MKYLKLIFLGTAFILLSSCSNNDDENNNMQDDANFAELIIGRWQPTEMIINGSVSSNPCDFAIAYNFNIDNLFGEGIIDGGSCVFTGNNGEYTITESNVTIVSARHSSEIDIQSLNDSEFVFFESRLYNGAEEPQNRQVTCQKIVD